MKALGIDIGTTTISAVVTEGGAILHIENIPNGTEIRTDRQFEYLQDVKTIFDKVSALVDNIFAQYPDLTCIGFTGQQHGIVYLDKDGNPLSPLYTWQDRRGLVRMADGRTYAETLSELTGYPMATGYGLTTHYYNLQNGLVPDNAAVFCTIHDYAAMRLAGLTSPRTDASDAASFGLFDVECGEFDLDALRKAGMDSAILPEVSKTPYLGTGALGIPVYTAIGDNQASFLGSVGGRKNCILLNAGTGGQFSAHTESYLSCPGLETRPYPAGGYLMVGSLLCGGRAYALLENFFRRTAEVMTGEKPESCYERMAALADTAVEGSPEVVPLFCGTRADPSLRASVTGLSEDNFTPEHLLAGLLRGMAKEYFSYAEFFFAAGGKYSALIGSGNGIRKNPALVKCIEAAFGTPLEISDRPEEAACGAAFYAEAAYARNDI